MSMIHQRLYQGKNLAAIEMYDYFINLGSHIIDSFGAENRVSLEYDIENIEFDIDTAIPIGLIVNELLTNALKYAFPDGEKGELKIGLKRVNNQTFVLEVTDNGIGQVKRDIYEGTGFGTQLIKLLILQLDGKMEYQSKKGTSVRLEFKLY
jgi:two-component sensor histidine kinase